MSIRANRALWELTVEELRERGDGLGRDLLEAAFLRDLDALDFSSERGLGASLKFAFIRVGDCESPEGAGAGRQRGFAQIRAAAVHAAESGLNWTAVLEAARDAVYGLYDDAEDARRACGRLLSLIEQGGASGSWYYEATRGSSCAALAP